MIVGLVIAKAHSRRLPNKNILPFCGLPLVEWPIIQSLCSKMIDKTYVSTDSEKIAEIAEKRGATVIWRDYVEAIDAKASVPYIHAIKKIQAEVGKIEVMAPLLATNPQRKPDDLDRGLRLWFELARKGIRLMEFPSTSIRHETLLYKIRQDKYGWKYRTLYADKFYSAGMDSTICSFMQPDKWLDYQAKSMPETTDTALDKKAHNDRMVHWWSRIPRHYKHYRYFWPIEEWQCPDIDYETQFYFVESIMNHFILKGRGPEIYYEYREQKVLPEL